MIRFTQYSGWHRSLSRVGAFIVLIGFWGVCLASPEPLLPNFTTCSTTGTATCTYSDAVGGVNTKLTITQTSATLIGSWDSFVIDASATVSFEQPAGGTALIRIPSGVSTFNGTFTATGTVILISPNGIVFNGAQLQGGLVASTLNLLDADYTAGKLDSSYFTGSTGTIQIDSSGVSGTASGKLRLLAATLAATGSVNLAEFALGKGVWTQNMPTLPAFSAASFRVDALAGTQFLRAVSGDGTASPYLLTDIYGLQGLGGALSYKLANDIDASATSTWSRPSDQPNLPHQGFQPIANFTGSLDGNGYTISNLYIRNIAANTGLIAVASGATLKDITLTGLNVTGAGLRVGGLAGYINNGTTVTDGHAAGSVTGATQVGGLIGWSQASSITDSSSSASVSGNISVGGLVGDAGGGSTVTKSSSSGTVTGTQAGGGLIGIVGTGGATISKSFATGAVALRTGSAGRYMGGLLGGGNTATTLGNNYTTSPVTGSVSVGGLVGDGNVSITNSYAMGAITAVAGTLPASPSDIGGLLGSGASANATDSFWNTETTGQATSIVGTGKTTAELHTQATFTNWDFTGIWTIPCGNNSYPYFRWQTLVDNTVPDPPTGVSATAGNAQATVSWTAPGCGLPITGYTVTASPSGQTCVTTGAATCAVTGLTNGVSYTFTVVATNTNGNSIASAASNSVTPVNPVNGVCGSANGQTFTSAPTSGFCTTGTASALSGSGPWSWNCAGSDGGNTANCSALFSSGGGGGATPVNGACGSSNSGTFTSAPTSGFCTTGTASALNGSGPWTWTCTGSNGGTTVVPPTMATPSPTGLKTAHRTAAMAITTAYRTASRATSPACLWPMDRGSTSPCRPPSAPG